MWRTKPCGKAHTRANVARRPPFRGRDVVPEGSGGIGQGVQAVPHSVGKDESMGRAINSSLKAGPRGRRFCALTGGALVFALLAGCGDGGKFKFPMPSAKTDQAQPAAVPGKTVERDVEAPDVFEAKEQGLWDGRPSLGGVWVAHPDVNDPERVIIRNEANGKFVVGALFRREREIPGPKLQISSDAAASLEILAGAPTALSVTALRREEVAQDPAVEDLATLEAPADISATALDPIASAEAAIDAAPETPSPPVAAPAPPPPPPTAEPAAVSSLSKPFIQIGIFSVEANADRTAKQMRGAGLVPTIKRGESNGKPFWRVVVGPATNKSELNSLLNTIKGEGFTDAYAVTN